MADRAFVMFFITFLAICFLAADEASFINGTTLIVDGGRLDIL